MPDIKTLRPIDKLIIHCSATNPKQDIGVEEVRDWHVKGNGWSDIGYHFFIRRDGTLETGRDIDKIGAHVAGQNAGSIGICMAGGIDMSGNAQANFTEQQWKELERFVRAFKAEYPKATVHGHNEFSNKACPSFSVQKWLKDNNI